jgi:UPF0716 protein FxsA
VFRLLLLFIALPALELALLIEIGQRIGTLETIGLIVVTGIVGAAAARSQGLRVLSSVQERLARGEMPADSLVDGLMILVASALLVTPGVLTDAFGFLCLVPAFRRVVKREVIRRFEQAVRDNRVHVDVQQSVRFDTRPAPGGSTQRDAPNRVIDVTPPFSRTSGSGTHEPTRDRDS